MKSKQSPFKHTPPVERAGNRLRPNITHTPPKKRDGLFFTLRARLFLLFILITFVPLSLLSVYSYLSTRRGLENAANQLLLVAARQTAEDINSFLAHNSQTVAEEARLAELKAYLSLPKDQRKNSAEEQKALGTIETLFSKQFILNPYIEAYLLLTRDGEIGLSTNPENTDFHQRHMGLNNVDPYAYNLMINSGYSYISPVLISSSGKKANLFFASRVLGDDQQVLGVIAAQYNARALQTIIDKNKNIAGPESYASLYDDKKIRLADGKRPDLLYKPVVPLADSENILLQSVRRLPSVPDQEISTNNPSLAAGLAVVYKNVPFFEARVEQGREEVFSGAVAQTDNRAWVVSFVQPQSVFLAPVQRQTQNTIYLTAAYLAFTAVIAGITTQRMTNPISLLKKAAERVASGDLWIQAPGGRDEIGQLGNAFNSMTTELRRTLEGLEQRVAERTVELAKASSEAQHRARQLETVSEVTRTITSIRDSDLLLAQVTQLISERFGYYHTGIFLIDKASGYAVLQAANSEGGQRMLARSHRLKVGEEGIVGYVTKHGKPRIALDVGSDAVFFDNPDLPYTRSEMALPLKSGSEIVGALDVQTMEQAAFSEEDVKLLSMLADQVSLAIENVRLYSEAKKALAEMQTLHRQYLREAWGDIATERSQNGYQYHFGKISPVQNRLSSEFWERLDEESITVIPAAEFGEARAPFQGDLIAPIRVRGQVIGCLDLDKAGDSREWTEEELNMISVMADQVGLAIENARLIEQTRLRAEREQLVSSITTKLRASNDPQQIIDTAVQELRQALRARRAHVVIPQEAPPIEDADRAQAQEQTSEIHDPAGSNGQSIEDIKRGEE